MNILKSLVTVLMVWWLIQGNYPNQRIVAGPFYTMNDCFSAQRAFASVDMSHAFEYRCEIHY